MSPIFDRYVYTQLHDLFHPSNRYAGYKPNVKEIPNADGHVDYGKRFLHVALKYNPPKYAKDILALAHFRACEIFVSHGWPVELMPSVENANLRVLEYPEGTGSARHTDFDLFTVNCWRNIPSDLVLTDAPERGWQETHLGELAEIYGLGKADPHEVPARPYLQKAIIYFASPAMSTPLPKPIVFPAQGEFAERTVTTSGQWQIERTNRSRVYG
jgi:hypothetical protein